MRGNTIDHELQHSNNIFYWSMTFASKPNFTFFPLLSKPSSDFRFFRAFTLRVCSLDKSCGCMCTRPTVSPIAVVDIFLIFLALASFGWRSVSFHKSSAAQCVLLNWKSMDGPISSSYNLVLVTAKGITQQISEKPAKLLTIIMVNLPLA